MSVTSSSLPSSLVAAANIVVIEFAWSNHRAVQRRSRPIIGGDLTEKKNQSEIKKKLHFRTQRKVLALKNAFTAD